MTVSEILERTLGCIRALPARSVPDADDETGLNADFWLNGAAFLRLGELLEEEFSISIGCDELIDVALNSRPQVGHLVELIQEKLDAA